MSFPACTHFITSSGLILSLVVCLDHKELTTVTPSVHTPFFLSPPHCPCATQMTTVKQIERKEMKKSPGAKKRSWFQYTQSFTTCCVCVPSFNQQSNKTRKALTQYVKTIITLTSTALTFQTTSSCFVILFFCVHVFENFVFIPL